MGCGCGKNRGKAAPLPTRQLSSSPTPTAARVAVYEVHVGGATVLSTTSATAARSEAKRLGGSIKVTSRTADLAPASA